jgi:3-dehydroquinate synthase
VDELLDLDESAITHVIKRSCEIKANIVSIDETERGARALLNLGHTFGHAIETNQGYGNWLHGEAVATGLVLAADLSMRTGRISADDASRIKRLVEKFKLPVCPPPNMSATQFTELMKVDKKATDAGIRLVLIGSIGSAVIVDDIEMSILEVTLESRDRLCEPI